MPEPLLTWPGTGLRLQVSVPIALERSSFLEVLQDLLLRRQIVIDGSQTNRETIRSCDTIDRLQDRSKRKLMPIPIRQSAYLNNRLEQEHRAIKRRIRPMLGFKSLNSARMILAEIEMVHMMRKGQAKYACNPHLSLAEQFKRIAE